MHQFAHIDDAIATLQEARAALRHAQADYHNVRNRLHEESGLSSSSGGDDTALLVPFVESMVQTALDSSQIAGGSVTLNEEALEDQLHETTGFPKPVPDHRTRTAPLFARLSEALWSRALSAQDVWDGLLHVLHSEETREHALAETANNLFNRIGSCLAGSVRRVAGKIVVSHYACPCSIFENRVEPGTVRVHMAFVASLGDVAEWANLIDTATQLRETPGQIDVSSQIKSRQRFSLGGGVELITFKTRFEYRLPESLGVALGQFVYRYAKDRMMRIRAQAAS